ncbi:hypothetical protein PN462_11070, partial [Spirulina sp. CS-785/01]|uniref:hypothetical protein n=1 Tax=Spirulina sp. CS-785/01 TaxID=3021716 RepID=UPI00232B3AF1
LEDSTETPQPSAESEDLSLEDSGDLSLGDDWLEDSTETPQPSAESEDLSLEDSGDLSLGDDWLEKSTESEPQPSSEEQEDEFQDTIFTSSDWPEESLESLDFSESSEDDLQIEAWDNPSNVDFESPSEEDEESLSGFFRTVESEEQEETPARSSVEEETGEDDDFAFNVSPEEDEESLSGFFRTVESEEQEETPARSSVEEETGESEESSDFFNIDRFVGEEEEEPDTDGGFPDSDDTQWDDFTLATSEPDLPDSQGQSLDFGDSEGEEDWDVIVSQQEDTEDTEASWFEDSELELPDFAEMSDSEQPMVTPPPPETESKDEEEQEEPMVTPPPTSVEPEEDDDWGGFIEFMEEDWELDSSPSQPTSSPPPSTEDSTQEVNAQEENFVNPFELSEEEDWGAWVEESPQPEEGDEMIDPFAMSENGNNDNYTSVVEEDWEDFTVSELEPYPNPLEDRSGDSEILGDSENGDADPLIGEGDSDFATFDENWEDDLFGDDFIFELPDSENKQ